MNKLNDRKLVIFYVWMAAAYLTLWIIHDLTNNPETFFPRLANNIWRVLFVSVLNFVFYEYSIPYILRKRKYLIYNILLALPIAWLHLMLWSYGLTGWRALGIAFGIYTPYVTAASADRIVEIQMGFSAGSIFFYGIVRHVFQYVRLRQAAQQLRIEKQEAELNYLKSQTNPHFLFNTLNNIYALTKEKSDLAPESVLRLSKILRFMLYETTGRFISVEQELRVITDYIELEKLRYDASLVVNFSYDVEDMRQAVPPLLLIPLVENAFKHGAAETRGTPFVDIHLSIRNRQLLFVVRNSAEAEPLESVKENIGLSNLRRQLQLLYRDHELSIRQEGNTFTATLKINLGSHV
ncbi:MAG TPA: histidine kinase [Chitinophagaceae bacterium]|nr:histidine kinase [Chitinophagaceae bacterium]